MGYKLVIAEKPSVAQSIARVIGAGERKDGYLEGNGYLVSWCFGHLVELAEPQEYDSCFRAWNIKDLPILPEHWKYRVSSGTRKQYSLLKKLMERKNVDSIVEATDAGRKGGRETMLAIRIIFKILAVSLFLIVGTVELLFKFLTNLSSYVIGPLMFFIIIWDIWFLFVQKWTQCLILTGLAVAGFFLFFWNQLIPRPR